MRFLPLLIAGLWLAVAACTSATSTPTPPEASGPTTPTPTRDRVAPDLDAVPALDTTKRVVELDDVVFDTFDGSFRRLPDVDSATVRRLRDLIRPIYNPQYEAADEASGWLDGGDRVIGVEFGGLAFAYPVRTLVFREIVNEVFGDTPAAITFCPLCVSGVVFDRRVDGRTLLFGNTSALYDNDMVMYDHETGSYWHQTSGRAIVGELAGVSMDVLPSLITTFATWRALYPDTSVLNNSKTQAARTRDPTAAIQANVNAGRFSFPMSEGATRDRRLALGTEVLMIRLAGERRAYALDDVRDGPANDRVGGLPVVVFADADTMAAYVAKADGRELTFEAVGPGGATTFTDRQTASVWDVAGRATSGPLLGTRLTLIPARRALWFAIAGSSPDVPLYRP